MTAVYKVFYKNYELKKNAFLGVLTERRKDLRGRPGMDSALRWARLTFGHTVKDRHAIFVVPEELNLKNNRTLEMLRKISDDGLNRNGRRLLQR